MAKAVENTINDPVRALIDPMYFTPYISAQVDDPRTLHSPLVMPINPKKGDYYVYYTGSKQFATFKYNIKTTCIKADLSKEDHHYNNSQLSHYLILKF